LGLDSRRSHCNPQRRLVVATRQVPMTPYWSHCFGSVDGDVNARRSGEEVVRDLRSMKRQMGFIAVGSLRLEGLVGKGSVSRVSVNGQPAPAYRSSWNVRDAREASRRSVPARSLQGGYPVSSASVDLFGNVEQTRPKPLARRPACAAAKPTRRRLSLLPSGSISREAPDPPGCGESLTRRGRA